jgi:raffinose/stachyose/melibiose transport system permease protein
VSDLSQEKIAVSGRRGGPRKVPWLLVVPGVLALLAFHFVPIGMGSYYAFTRWNGLTHAQWIGLGNFRSILEDPATSRALWNTLELAVAFLVLVNVTGLLLALGLNRTLRTRYLLRSLIFVPVALSPLAVAYIWQYIYTYQGLLNRILGDLGLSSLQRDWLGDPSTVLWTILVLMVWQFSGLTMVIYLAGLQSVPDEVYEASLVDGASTWLHFRKVVFPLLAPACSTRSWR